jgi:hypothetical protein
MDPYYHKAISTGSTTHVRSKTLLPMFEIVVNLSRIKGDKYILGEATMTTKRSDAFESLDGPRA